jgi:hypothetical protein
LDHLLVDVGVVLLQREVPEHVNMAVAEAAARAQVPVLLVRGGITALTAQQLLQGAYNTTCTLYCCLLRNHASSTYEGQRIQPDLSYITPVDFVFVWVAMH